MTELPHCSLVVKAENSINEYPPTYEYRSLHRGLYRPLLDDERDQLESPPPVTVVVSRDASGTGVKVAKSRDHPF